MNDLTREKIEHDAAMDELLRDMTPEDAAECERVAREFVPEDQLMVAALMAAAEKTDGMFVYLEGQD